MDKYTASNGRHISTARETVAGGEHVGIYFGADGRAGKFTMTEAEYDALREYFRAEEDERLGWWRYDDHTTVRLVGEVAHIHDERAGHVSVFNRSWIEDTEIHGSDAPAALAFFAAHPEPSYTTAEWVAKAMYEAKYPGFDWETAHADVKTAWLITAEAAIAKYEEVR